MTFFPVILKFPILYANYFDYFTNYYIYKFNILKLIKKIHIIKY